MPEQGKFATKKATRGKFATKRAPAEGTSATKKTSVENLLQEECQNRESLLLRRRACVILVTSCKNKRFAS